MIKLRTITYQIDNKSQNLNEKILNFKNFYNEFSDLYASPRTIRLSTSSLKNDEDYCNIQDVMRLCKENDIWGLGIEIDLISDVNNIVYAKDLIKNDFIFLNLLVSKNESINFNAMSSASKFIIDSSKKDTLYNFRIGIGTQDNNFTPFFPFANFKEDNSFAIGLELIDNIDKIINKFSRASIEDIRKNIKKEIIKEAKKINFILNKLSKKYNVKYNGIDFSIAPFPYPLEDQSVISIIEKLGNIGRSRGEDIFEFGDNGTYFLNSFLTSIIKEVAKETNGIGFNGVMYSLIEDSLLSLRYSEEKFNFDFLKLLATSCGCGIDMVPVYGDISENVLSSIILDIFTMSKILNKPLGIRILPITDSRYNDKTKFRHEFLTNTKILNINNGLFIHKLPKQNYEYIVKKYEK